MSTGLFSPDASSMLTLNGRGRPYKGLQQHLPKTNAKKGHFSPVYELFSLTRARDAVSVIFVLPCKCKTRTFPQFGRSASDVPAMYAMPMDLIMQFAQSRRH